MLNVNNFSAISQLPDISEENSQDSYNKMTDETTGYGSMSGHLNIWSGNQGLKSVSVVLGLWLEVTD